MPKVLKFVWNLFMVLILLKILSILNTIILELNNFLAFHVGNVKLFYTYYINTCK